MTAPFAAEANGHQTIGRGFGCRLAESNLVKNQTG